MASIFQVRYEEGRYPISRFVTHRAKALGLSRADLACRLGYQDTSNAHKALAEVLTTGTVPRHMQKHLAKALELDEAMVEAVLELTIRQRQDGWRARLLVWEQQYAAEFQPHLRTETERIVPEPIFIAALGGSARLRFVELPPEI